MMYNISDALIPGIKHFEGFASMPYVCPTGHLTIGYGHVIQPGETDSLKHLTEDQATRLLLADLQRYADDVARLLPGIQDNQQQFDALIDWTYNLGASNLESSTLRRLYNTGHHEDAGNQITRWVYGRVKGKATILPGLVRRRNWELGIYKAGQYAV